MDSKDAGRGGATREDEEAPEHPADAPAPLIHRMDAAYSSTTAVPLALTISIPPPWPTLMLS